MLIFLSGSDGYRLKQNIEKITAEYRKKHESGLNFLSLDLGEGAADGLARADNFLKTTSFFKEKKLLVLKNIFQGGDELVELFKNHDIAGDRETIIVACSQESDKESAAQKSSLLKFLSSKASITKKLEPLKGRMLESWLAQQVKECGAEINAGAARKLIECVGNNSWNLKQEVEKLANYVSAFGRKSITEEEINLLITPKINLNIFAAIDALAEKNKTRSLTLLANHLENGDDPHYLFSMIVYQFRNLLRVKDITVNLPKNSVASPTLIAQKTGLHPFVAQKTLAQSKKFELAELKEKFINLAEADVEIKNGQRDIVDYLYQFALG